MIEQTIKEYFEATKDKDPFTLKDLQEINQYLTDCGAIADFDTIVKCLMFGYVKGITAPRSV